MILESFKCGPRVLEEFEMTTWARLVTGKAVTIFSVHERIDAIIKNLDVWSSQMGNKAVHTFPKLNSFDGNSTVELQDS